MRKIFEDHRFEIVGQFASILEAEGIEVFIKNEASCGVDGVGIGDIIRPELFVVDDSRYEEALELLKPHYEVLRERSLMAIRHDLGGVMEGDAEVLQRMKNQAAAAV